MTGRGGVPAHLGLVLTLTFASSAVGAWAAGVKLLPLEDPAPQAQGRFGEAIAGLGDIDGDGVGDVAVGAPGKERVVLFSGATRAVIRTLQDPGGLTGNRFGFSVISAGDVSGDGADDVAVARGPRLRAHGGMRRRRGQRGQRHRDGDRPALAPRRVLALRRRPR